MWFKKKGEKKKSAYKYFWYIVSISIIIVASLWYYNFNYGMNLDHIHRGIFGDMFGAVNAVFSGLAFAGIIISLYLQRIDLKNQFEEIKKTNEEFEKQNKTINSQKFENQYYKMIDLHKQNVNEISIPFYEVVAVGKSRNKIVREVKGKNGFVDMVIELDKCLQVSKETLEKSYKDEHIFEFAYRLFFWGVNSNFSESKDIKTIDQSVVKVSLQSMQRSYKSNTGLNLKTRYMPFQGHESRLAHYYRHLFQTVKYVVKQEEDGIINYQETRQYLRILRAQLSNSEQLMLYYNYICGFGGNWDRLGRKGYKFFTRYRMIHNLPIDKVKYVEHPYAHFEEYRNSKECLDDKMFEWED